jgi:L-fucose isomerase-like protein
VVLPNFGDEKGVADTLKLSRLNVPVLIQAYPDDLKQLSPARRRDAYCGKISVCNNLVQAGIKFSLTSRHVSHPASESFTADLQAFLGVCRIVNGLRGVRLGAVGARPGAFNTVRYSEKLLERHGISVTTVDLSEMLAKANALDAAAAAVKTKLSEIKGYAPAPGVPADKLLQMAKMGVVLSEWMAVNSLDATAIQCWTSVQQNLGCNVCTLMSMMSERFLPSACEVDVTGVLTMYAMQLAAQSPAALVDWNNNYSNDDDKCVLFHCGNWAKSFLPDIKIANAPILGSILGVENTYGALEGRTPAGPLTFGRITTADADGCIRAYVGEGELTNDPLDTFGNRAVARIPRLQSLMKHVCRKGFEHHVVMTCSKSAAILAEALGNYFGWDVQTHEA